MNVCAFLVIKTNMMTPVVGGTALLDALPWKSANATSSKRTQHSAWIGAKQYQKCENVFTYSMHGRVFIYLHYYARYGVRWLRAYFLKL
jgi:hypothetical protein